MFYVYLIESVSVPGQRYIGFTTNLKQRFDDHNAGKSSQHRQVQPLEVGDIYRVFGPC
jgi:predicted GIY-YIG superfamily endonuclease